jgi:hypothetical protein
LIGDNGFSLGAGSASSSYSTGKVEVSDPSDYAGGLIGFDETRGGYIDNTYWDTSTSKITDPGQGAGSPPDDPGITGLTTKQLQSGLPDGFDPSVWAENSNINNGLPYLINDPPPN